MSNPPKLTANKLCARCLRPCKQDDTVVLLECPRFYARPFKSPVYAFDQLDLFSEKKSSE